MSNVDRRKFLVAGASALALVSSGACTPRTTKSPPESASSKGSARSGSFTSRARGGVLTNWTIARPAATEAPLHPVIALHWRTGNAQQVMAFGVADQLAQVVSRGAPGFAVVSVDGGDTYWHRRGDGSDSGAMITDELLPILADQGLDTTRIGFMGWSMGGYGALLLGARIGAPRVAAISICSPALWARDGFPPVAFDSVEDWDANSVWGLTDLESIPVRIDCGTEDFLYAQTKMYVDQLEPKPAGGFSPGKHDDTFMVSQMGAELAWIAPFVAAGD